jgi:hypothetical protein
VLGVNAPGQSTLRHRLDPKLVELIQQVLQQFVAATNPRGSEASPENPVRPLNMPVLHQNGAQETLDEKDASLLN